MYSAKGLLTMHYEESKDRKDDFQPDLRRSLNDCHLSSVQPISRILTDTDGGRGVRGRRDYLYRCVQ